MGSGRGGGKNGYFVVYIFMHGASKRIYLISNATFLILNAKSFLISYAILLVNNLREIPTPVSF